MKGHRGRRGFYVRLRARRCTSFPEQGETWSSRRPTGDNLLEVIARAQDSLRKSDRRVAEVVLERPAEVVDMTLAALARYRRRQREPTVIRFAPPSAATVFAGMRVKLAHARWRLRTTSHTAISDADDETVITKIFDFNLSNLNWARSHL